MAQWDRYKGSMTSSSNMPWDIGGAATPTTQPPKPVRGRGPKRKGKARPNSNLQKRAKEAGSVYSKAFFAATVDAMAHNIPLPDSSVEYITSFDCLEHCLPEDIDTIVDE